MKNSIQRCLTAALAASSAAWLLPSCGVTAAPNQPPSPAAKISDASLQTEANQAAPVAVTMTNKAPGALPRALWVWDATVMTDAKHGQDLFDFCALKGISVIYLDMGDLLLPKKREVGDSKHITAPVLGQFLQKAHDKKLQVEALDGAPEFALAAHHAEALGHLQNALSYNQAAAANQRLDGFQWDTEPYILAEFKAGGASQGSVLKQYLDGAAQMRDAVQKSPTLRLGYAIPSFFDDKERNVTWGGVTKPVAFQLMDILNALPASYVAIMAYRDKAPGPNGSIEISRGEIEYAAKNTPKLKVWIGQETLDVTGDPPSITFYEEGENALEQALGQIQTAYKGQPALAGLAIHHWGSYRVMKAGEAIAPVKVAAPITETLSILTPQNAAAVTPRMEVTGTAKPGGEGVKVEVSVRPEGDIWYSQGETPLGADGTWSVTARFGNDQTPAGRAFELRAQLKKADGTVVSEKTMSVKTR